MDSKTSGRLLSLLGAEEQSSMGTIILAAVNWDRKSPYFAHTHTALRSEFTTGVRDLYAALQKAPERAGVSGIPEFVLGYVPLDGASLSKEAHTRLATWYDCLGEAFRLLGVDVRNEPYDLEPLAVAVNALAQRIAELLIPISASHSRLKDQAL